MAKRTESIGSGMTKRTVTRYSGSDMGPLLRRVADQWNEAWKAGGSAFGAVTLEMVRECEAVLAQHSAEEEFEADSVQDLARRILDLHRAVVVDVVDGSADSAARFAFGLGALYAQASMKEEWEPDALRGRLARERFEEFAEAKNQKRQAVALARHSHWLPKALEQLGKPNASALSVAKWVLKQTYAPKHSEKDGQPKFSVDRVRKIIGQAAKHAQ